MAATTEKSQKEQLFSRVTVGSFDSSMTRCMSCEMPAKNVCATCKVVFYCSRACQLVDWQRHKYEHSQGEDAWKVMYALEDLCLTFQPFIRIKHTGDSEMGMGGFARKDITAGTRLLCENAFAIDNCSKLATNFLQSASPVELFQFWSFEHDKSLKTDVERATSAIHRNGLMDTIKGPTSKDPAFALFFIFSRFNHSCGPNAIYTYDKGEKTVSVYAARDIKRGEEVTIYWHYAYFLDREYRHELFQNRFGKKCQCGICTKEDKHVMDETMAQATETIFETLKTEKSFHNFLDEQDNLGILSISLIFRNMKEISDMLHGFENTVEVPYSPYRKIIYKNFPRFLSSYPFFKRMKKTPEIKKKFNALVKESIAFFELLQEESEVDSLKKILLR
jgi:hypothetical protein